jgi:hypothetical protein
MKGRVMTTADQVRASDTGQGTQKSLWERYLEKRRRLGPALTDAQWDELKELGHRLLNPRFGLTVRHISHSSVAVG